MPSLYLTKYLEDEDKFGEKVGEWAEQLSKGVVKCKTCESHFKFHKGKEELIRHSQNKKHQEAKKRQKNKIYQKNLFDFVGKTTKEDELKSQARDLEIALVALLSNHEIPPTFAECLVSVLKKYVTDSEIIKNVMLGHEKSRYLTVYGLGNHFEAQTVMKMKN